MHVKGEIRGLFTHCVDAWDGETKWWAPLANANPSETVGRKVQKDWMGMNKEDRARWLIGQLWNCTNLCPREVADSLDMPNGTFASVVRRLAVTDPPDSFSDLIRRVEKKRQQGQESIIQRSRWMTPAAEPLNRLGPRADHWRGWRRDKNAAEG